MYIMLSNWHSHPIVSVYHNRHKTVHFTTAIPFLYTGKLWEDDHYSFPVHLSLEKLTIYSICKVLSLPTDILGNTLYRVSEARNTMMTDVKPKKCKWIVNDAYPCKLFTCMGVIFHFIINRYLVSYYQKLYEIAVKVWLCH